MIFGIIANGNVEVQGFSVQTPREALCQQPVKALKQSGLTAFRNSGSDVSEEYERTQDIPSLIRALLDHRN